jgi:hypothetical protein
MTMRNRLYRQLSRSLLLLVGAFGVGLPAQAKEPPTAEDRNTVEYVGTRFPTESEKASGHAVPDSYFGVTTMRRGSLVLGLLLGPLGAAANAAHVQSESEKAASPMKALLAEDLRKALLAAAPTLSAEAPGPKRHFQLVPSAGLRFQTDETYRLMCILHAQLMDQGKEVWRARYVVNTGTTYTSTSSEDAKGAAAALQPCLAQAYALYRMHKDNALGSLKGYDIRAGHPFGGPVVERLLPDRVVLVEPRHGLFEIFKGDVTKMEPL